MDTMGSRPTGTFLQVVAGLIQDESGRVLVGQRRPGTHMAGYWEFPGGKCCSGESPRQALDRELREELGIRVLSATFLTTLTHSYPDRRVRLELWRVERYEGDPVSRENQPLSWSLPEELLELPILPADEPFVRSLLAAQRPNEAV